jgi:hypothetical protein
MHFKSWISEPLVHSLTLYSESLFQQCIYTAHKGAPSTHTQENDTPVKYRWLHTKIWYKEHNIKNLISAQRIRILTSDILVIF